MWLVDVVSPKVSLFCLIWGPTPAQATRDI